MKKLLFLFPLLLLAGCWQESQCQDLVKDKLSAPSTAIFSKMETYETEWFWTVIGWKVESQNRLGAMVWSDFYCLMDEKAVIFDTDSEYEGFRNMLKSITKVLSDVNKKDKKACEKSLKKLAWDNIKIIDFLWNEQERNGSRVNWIIIEELWDMETVVCEVDIKSNKVKSIRYWDKKYEITE